MLLNKLHKFLKWMIIIQILLTVISSEEATIVTGIVGMAFMLMYCKFTNWFYRSQLEVG